MKRKLAILLAALLLLTAPALADGADGYWTSSGDFYYHAVEDCGGISGRVPISPEGAAEFEKYPCPVCVPEEDDGGEPVASARGGVIVVRFSDSWLAKQELTGVFGFMGEGIYEGAEAERTRAELLHGEACANFPEDGTKVWALAPFVLESDGDEELCTILCRRHIGSAWYVILLPTQRFGDSWEMYWRVNADQVWMEGDALHTCFERQTVEEHRKLKLALLNGSEPVFNRVGEPELRVYEALYTHIAVVYESDPDENLLEDVELRIGGEYAGTVRGRMQGGRAVYYCALTEGELYALREGAEAELVHASPVEGADFCGTPYAAAVYGSSEKMGIIDRDGNWVVEPVFESVRRPSREDGPALPEGEPLPFFCHRDDGTSIVIDDRDLSQIAEVEGEAYYAYPGVFRTVGDWFAGGSDRFYSLDDGSFLFDMEEGGYAQIDSDYREFIEGRPARLVAWYGGDSNGRGEKVFARLIDNAGEAIPNTDYRCLTPLCWQGERGLFLAETFEPAERDPKRFDCYGNFPAYDGRSSWGPHWRCGLIDQDGNTLAEVKYVKIEYLGEGAFQLTGEDGETETIRMAASEE